MARVKLITDSASDLSAADAERLDITIVPLTIRFDDEEFVDGVELSNEQFWTKTEASSTLPSTAAPSPGAFAEAFRKAKADGYDAAVCVTLSSDLSGTFQSATAGAALVEGEVEVHIVDSRSCTVAQAEVCLLTAAKAAAGATGSEVAQYSRECAANQRLLGTLDTLDYLKKGGRIGAAGAFFAALLSVKPIITITEGVVKPLSKQRTRSKAVRQLAELVIAEGKVANVGVSHSGAPDLEQFLDMLVPVAKREDILVTQMGPTIGVHGGPRLIAVTFSPEKASDS